MTDHAAPVSAEATMKQFRKKPVVIEAEQLTEAVALDCLENRKPFAFGLTISGSWNAASNKLYSAWISIDTLEGQMRAELGDWIIKGVKGELYPCKPDIFEATYDAVTAHNGTADTGNTSEEHPVLNFEGKLYVTMKSSEELRSRALAAEAEIQQLKRQLTIEKVANDDLAKDMDRLSQVNGKLVADMQKLEWIGTNGTSLQAYCPVCLRHKKQGHEGCWFGAALAEAQKETGQS